MSFFAHDDELDGADDDMDMDAGEDAEAAATDADEEDDPLSDNEGEDEAF